MNSLQNRLMTAAGSGGFSRSQQYLKSFSTQTPLPRPFNNISPTYEIIATFSVPDSRAKYVRLFVLWQREHHSVARRCVDDTAIHDLEEVGNRSDLCMLKTENVISVIIISSSFIPSIISTLVLIGQPT